MIYVESQVLMLENYGISAATAAAAAAVVVVVVVVMVVDFAGRSM